MQPHTAIALAEIGETIKSVGAGLRSAGPATNSIEYVAVAQRVLGAALPQSASQALKLAGDLTHLLESGVYVGDPAAPNIKAVMLGLITLAQVDLLRLK